MANFFARVKDHVPPHLLPPCRELSYAVPQASKPQLFLNGFSVSFLLDCPWIQEEFSHWDLWFFSVHGHVKKWNLFLPVALGALMLIRFLSRLLARTAHSRDLSHWKSKVKYFSVHQRQKCSCVGFALPTTFPPQSNMGASGIDWRIVPLAVCQGRKLLSHTKQWFALLLLLLFPVPAHPFFSFPRPPYFLSYWGANPACDFPQVPPGLIQPPPRHKQSISRNLRRFLGSRVTLLFGPSRFPRHRQ